MQKINVLIWKVQELFFIVYINLLVLVDTVAAQAISIRVKLHIPNIISLDAWNICIIRVQLKKCAHVKLNQIILWWSVQKSEISP